MPAWIVKPVNEPPYFQEVIYTFYRQSGEVTWKNALYSLIIVKENRKPVREIEVSTQGNIQ